MHLTMSDEANNSHCVPDVISPDDYPRDLTENNEVYRSHEKGDMVDIDGTFKAEPSSPRPTQPSPIPYSKFNASPHPRPPLLTQMLRRQTTPPPVEPEIDVVYENDSRNDNYSVAKNSMMEMSHGDMSEGNMAALALTHQENLDSRVNGLSDENGVSPDDIKSESEHEDSQAYSNEASVYTDISSQANNESASLTTLQPYAGQLVTGLSSNGPLSRGGYTVQPLTQFQPGIQSTQQYNFFDNAGHLLPQEDVEDFFKNMERPMATTVSLSGVYPGTAENGHYTTLTNTPGLTLAQTYQPATESARLMTFQPPSYSETQNSYALTHLYGSRASAIQNQYLTDEEGTSSSPTPASNSGWGVSAESLYSNHGITSLSAQKYGFQGDSPNPRDSGLSNSPTHGQFSRVSGLTAGTNYSSYMAPDVNGASWMYQNMPSPYTDVKVTGKSSLCVHISSCYILLIFRS